MAQTKATITTVKFGGREIEGLMLPDGSYALSITQANELLKFDVSIKSQVTTVKRLLGGSFDISKVPTEVSNSPKAVLSLVQFETLLAKLDRAGNKAAQDFRDDLVGLSLHQLFCDAFGVKFEGADRQAWVEARNQARQQHQPCVTLHWATLDGLTNSLDYVKRTGQLKKAGGLKGNLGVNDMDKEEMVLWTNAQKAYGIFRKLGDSHEEAIIKVARVS